MKILAIRCSNTDFAFAVIDGTQDKPNIIECRIISYPKGYEEFALLQWFHQEISELLHTFEINMLIVKASETNVKRSNNLEIRIRIEGIALMSASEVGCSGALRKVKSTIAKDLGMKGKGKYLETKLDTSPIQNFDSYNTKQQEAILAGWSSLN